MSFLLSPCPRCEFAKSTLPSCQGHIIKLPSSFCQIHIIKSPSSYPICHVDVSQVAQSLQKEQKNAKMS
jgi:hypothetical protein